MPDPATTGTTGTPGTDATWESDVQDLILHGRDREAAELAVGHLGTTTDPHPPEASTMDARDQLHQVGGLLGQVAGGIAPDQLDAPTPCAGFGVRDVLGHMVAGATHFGHALRGEPSPEPDGDPAAGDDVVERAAGALGELFAAVDAPGALERSIESPFGTITGEELVRYLALDGLVHGWDLATATGQAYDPPAPLVAEVDGYARSFLTPERRDGDAFAAPAEPPAGATPIERLAAFTGRSA